MRIIIPVSIYLAADNNFDSWIKKCEAEVKGKNDVHVYKYLFKNLTIIVGMY